MGGFLEQPVLVVGAAGMLGRAMMAALDRRGANVTSGDRVADSDRGIEPFDLTDAADIGRVSSGAWGTVINCAAWTDVDGAETQEDAATVLNGTAVGELADACRGSNTKLVHFSTDYVFDGQGTRPYATDHRISPINAYGRSKADGERRIVESGCDALVIRTSWLYAPWGKNFVLTMASLLGTRDTLRVVDDQVGRPTSALQLAETTLGLLEARASGVFHGCDDDQCTWFEFARTIGEQLGSDCVVEPCSSDEFPRPARRPSYSVLDMQTTFAHVDRPRPWREALAETLKIAGGARTL